MKEQILYLDPHDDYHSLRDKIGWVQTDRVLLVLPERRGNLPPPRARSARRGKRPFNRPLDLLLIQRHAGKLGAKLALVTDDPVISDYADTLGIQVFDAIDDSHLHTWRSRRPLPPTRQPKPKPDPEDEAPLFTLPRFKFLQSRRLPALAVRSGRLAASAFVFFLAVSIVALMLALTAPGAHLTLTPREKTLNLTMPVTADPAQKQIEIAAGVIPARAISVVVAGAAEVAATGSVDEASQRAGGRVTFTNLTNLQVRIPAGTAVRTTGGTPIRFVTQEDVVLETKKGATGAAYVLAEEPGPPGNVGAGLINSIEGPLAIQAAVINEAPTSGGEVKQVASVSAADRERVKEALLAQLRQQGYAELLTQLNEGEFAPLGSLAIVRVLDETYSHFTGEKAERLNLEMRVEVGATAVDEQLAFSVGQAALEAQLGNTLLIIPNTTLFTRDQATDIDSEGRVRFNITARAEAGAAINPDDARVIARWQLVKETPDLLYSQLPLAARPTVTVWPSWFPRLPWLAWRIEVEISNS